MKKYLFLFLFSFLVLLPSVNAACDTSSVDTSKYEYITKLRGASALNSDQYYDKSVCCQEDNIYTCYVYNEKEEFKEDTKKEDTKEESTTTTTNINYCANLKSTLTFIGHIVRIAKILIPIIIIGFGMMDFFKAVTGAKDDEIKKSFRSLLFRCIAGVCIFFLPAFIDLIFSFVDSWGGYQSSYEECFKCIWDVGNC